MVVVRENKELSRDRTRLLQYIGSVYKHDKLTKNITKLITKSGLRG